MKFRQLAGGFRIQFTNERKNDKKKFKTRVSENGNTKAGKKTSTCIFPCKSSMRKW